ncbi:MAG: phosphatidylserine decarboxylase [Kouleothrix sp.]|jgi:phosphatidylserine decarboxylase|nr:phosphatidylserine decarboxylase [Kouleothrix sp.]
MPQHTIPTTRKAKLPGFDSGATPVLGVGLGLTGLLLGLKPRLAAWPLALTAVAALLYRDPERITPAEPDVVFAPADGTVIGVEELYEHRFLHTDAVRIAIAAAPFDVPVHRSPVAGMVAYLDHMPGEYRPIWDLRAAEHNERTYIGIKTAWGPIMLQIVGGPLARRVTTHVALGQPVQAGERLGTVRFGARVDLLLPYEIVDHLPPIGSRVHAGTTRIGRVAPL